MAVTNPFLAKVKQTSDDVWGKEIRKLAIYGLNGGIGAGTEDGDLPEAAGNQYENFVLSLKNLYGSVEISDKAVRAAEHSAGAFVNLLTAEMEGLIRSSSFNFGRMLFGDGSGTLCKRIPVALRADREQFPVERGFNPSPFIPDDPQQMQQRCEEIFSIQVGGLAQRIRHTGTHSAVVGISGGLDSTLALLVAVRTFDKLGLPRRNILGVTMPGFGTTDRTHTNALRLMESLGVGIREISIREACAVHFRDIGMDDADRSVAYENAQARERTQILMDLANRTGGLVIGTGDLSELALGWATYNGDHMSMYGVNCGVPKTLVRHLVRWVAAHPDYEVARGWLLDIVDTPISPELLPADEKGEIVQKTEDLVGPYELHDFFLYHFVRFGCRPAKLHFMACRAFAGKYDAKTVKKWLTVFLRRFFSQQFKRSALPDGPKVGSVSLSPRGDWRMPSDASPAMWIREAESL